MGLKIDRLLKDYLPETVRLSPKGSETRFNGPVYLSPRQCDTIYVLVDTEGCAYHLPFSDPTRSYTFRDIVQHVSELVQHYLSKPGDMRSYSDVVVDLRCDLKTPPNKALTRKTDGSAPPLPINGEKDPMMAWYAQFSSHHSTVVESASFDSKRAMSFELPLTRKQAIKRGLKEGEVYYFEHYLHSPGFKRFLNRVVFENVLGFVQFPSDCTGHAYVLARSRDISNMRTPTSYGPIPSHLQFDYQEADCVIGAVSARCRHPLDQARWCDLLAVSTSSDGDTFLVLAAARNRAMAPAPRDSAQRRLPESADDLRFYNAVTVLRSNVFYNFNEFYACLLELHRMKASAGLEFSNPVLAAFVPMMIGGATFDYTSRGWLPGVADGTLCSAYYRNIDYFQTLVSSHVDQPNLVVVDPNALGRLIASACKRAPSEESERARDPTKAAKRDKDSLRIDLDYTEACKAEGKPLPTPDQILILAAQLSWAFSYFTASSYELIAPDAFQTSSGSGFSLWGYAHKNIDCKDERPDIGAPDRVDFQALMELYGSKKAVIDKERAMLAKTSQLLHEIHSDQYAF